MGQAVTQADPFQRLSGAVTNADPLKRFRVFCTHAAPVQYLIRGPAAAAGTSNSAHVTLTLTGTRKTSSATRGDDPLYLFFTSAPDLRYPGQRLQTLFADTAYPLAMSMTISGSCAAVESGTNIMTKAESANTSGMPVSSGP